MTLDSRTCTFVDDTIDITADDDRSAGVDLDGKPILGLLVPVLNDTPIVTLELSADGENWYAIKDANGSTDSVSITGGTTAFFVSSDVLTPLAAYAGRLPGGVGGMKVRVVTSESQSADRVFTWIAMT